MNQLLEKTISVLPIIFYYGIQSFKVLEYYSVLLLNALVSLSNQVSNELETETAKYPYKYEKEFDELTELEITEEEMEQLKTNFVKDMTPGGEIVMAYDYKNDIYIYFSESSHIQYRFLDTVAMKFVIIHNTKKIYKYLKNEMEYLENKQKENLIEPVDNEETNNENKSIKQKRDELFVKFKTYNKKIHTQKLIKENLNKFKRMGNLLEYEQHIQLLDTQYIQVENPKNKLSYRDFKYSIMDC